MDDDDEYDEYEQNTQTKKRSCYERLTYYFMLDELDLRYMNFTQAKRAK